MDLIGLTKQQAIAKLKDVGINDIVFIENLKNPLPNSTQLVTACKIKNNTAQITLGSFKLNL